MIKDIKELNFPAYATLTQATVTLQDMGEKTITSQVKIDGDITPDFSFDWEVEFRGEKYIMPLRQPQGAKENTSMLSTIDLTFQHWAVYQLKRWYFFTVPPMDSGTAIPDQYEASVSLNLKEFCKLAGQVLAYYYGDKITIDFNDPESHPGSGWEYQSEPTTVEISHSHVWDVIIKLYELYAVRWQINTLLQVNNEMLAAAGKPLISEDSAEGMRLKQQYVIRVGYPSKEIDHFFEYGFEGGLLNVERQVQDENIRNMLIGRGGEKNLPYRYFKKHDKENDSFSPDPDWIPELKDIYFSELRGATFRSYIQGWKAAHYEEYRKEYPDEEWVVTTPRAEYAYSPWAWQKGYTDEKFDPVEYVADEITIDPKEGRNHVEISPTYSPLVKVGSSIEKYGPLFDGLDNNEEIYPTIQGVVVAGLGRIDQTIDIEPITNDDIEQYSEAEAQTSNVGGATSSMLVGAHFNGHEFHLVGPRFSIPSGMTGSLYVEAVQHSAHSSIELWYGEQIEGSQWIVENKTTVVVVPEGTQRKLAPVGLPAGTYHYEVTVEVQNTSDLNLMTTIEISGATLTFSEEAQLWQNTWNIWVKNLWESEKEDSETAQAYAKRIWLPILGDRVGNEAKVVFSDGWLSTSEDYEFVITKIPEYDPNKTIVEKDASGKIIAEYPSHWKITLAKSDADLESTGLYIPSTKRQAEPGDHFFFIGIDMPHMYVVKAEERIDDWKKENLNEVKDIKPSWVVGIDKVRVHQHGAEDALANALQIGSSFTLFDKRFIPGSAQEKLYLQSITYTYNEPTDTAANLLPDIEVVLSDKYETVANPVEQLSGEVDVLSQQLGSISNIEQIVRKVGDKIYLRKDGITDRSLSPTEFFSLLTSGGFRSGIVGGQGWGFFKDENGNWVLETDKINVRQDMQVNNLVINQIISRGGMIVESAAQMEVTRVVYDGEDYTCYFDQKNGTVANLFNVGDVAWCNRYTPENGELKFYKRRVNAVTENYVVLAGNPNILYTIHSNTGIMQASTGVNGDGVPAEGDVIVHFGSYTDPARRFAKVRDIINGGYERYLEGLNSVNATGTEYYYVGRQTGVYGDRPRLFMGDSNGWIKYENGVFELKARLHAESTIDGETIKDFLSQNTAALLDLTNEVQSLVCDAQGNVLSGLPVKTTAKVYQGGTAGVGWELSINAENCIATITKTTGEIVVSAIEVDATTASVEVTASKKGYDDLHATLSIYKVIPGSDGKSPTIYGIEPTVNNITRNADGTLSVNSLQVTKYAQTAQGRIRTSEKWLYYQLEGIMATETLVSADGGESVVTIGPIPDNAKSIILTLKDESSVILDRERIPILTDAVGLEVGGVNLLRNTNQGTRNWILNYSAGGAMRLAASTADSGVTVVNEGDYSSGTPAWQMVGFTLPENTLKAGEHYMLSFQAQAVSANPVTLQFQISKNTGAGLITHVEHLAMTSGFSRYEIAIKPTADQPDNVYIWFYIHCDGQWGTISFKDIMLETGMIATAWSPSPLDINYLKQALTESTVLDGGLILTSLIKVGTETDADTLAQKTTAGINGIVNDTPGMGGGIAIWAGGDMVDAANPDGDQTSDVATAAIRHDGTAYFASNTIRFAKDIVEVGDAVELTREGLILLDSAGKQRLKVANVSVGDSVDIDAVNVAINSTGVSRVVLQRKTKKVQILVPGTGNTPGYIDIVDKDYLVPIEADSYTYNIVGEITPGAAVNLRGCTVSIDTSGTGDSPALELEGTVYFRIGRYVGSTKEYVVGGESNSDFKLSSGSLYVAELKSMYLPPSNISGGSYFVEISIKTSTQTAGGAKYTKQAAVSISGSAQNTYESSTVLGNDGFLSVWGKVGVLVNENKIIFRAGNNLLRISETGIEKNYGGGSGNWVSI